MRTALVIGGRPDYAGPAVRILPRTGARIIDFSINNNDQQQQLIRCMIKSHYLPLSAVSCWQPASQELRQREAANTSWRSPVRASAPFGLRRGAGANTVGVVVVVALVVVAHFAPRPPRACNWRCHLLPPRSCSRA